MALQCMNSHFHEIDSSTFDQRVLCFKPLSSGQLGEVYEVNGDRVAVILDIGNDNKEDELEKDEKLTEHPAKALVYWIDDGYCYIATEVLCEVLRSMQPLIAYFPDSSQWLSRAVPKTKTWFGDAEKLTKALFSFASKLAPVIIFVDEVDSLLGARGGSFEHEATRRRRNEFMAAWDGLRSKDSQRILILGATNRPFDLDDAVIRRIHVDLPDAKNRMKILRIILNRENLESDLQFDKLANATEDIPENLCIAAAYRPVEELLEEEKCSDKNPSLQPLSRLFPSPLLALIKKPSASPLSPFSLALASRLSLPLASRPLFYWNLCFQRPLPCQPYPNIPAPLSIDNIASTAASTVSLLSLHNLKQHSLPIISELRPPGREEQTEEEQIREEEEQISENRAKI
uniref:ATPase AAA-type core domain-containing protein n=1 Tax=Salix viminalis TaxID=40686 RepID=A0A6N2MUA9_SALVM